MKDGIVCLYGDDNSLAEKERLTAKEKKYHAGMMLLVERGNGDKW